MRKRSIFAIAAAALVCGSGATAMGGGEDGIDYQDEWSVARYWNETLMSAIRVNFPNPPIHARNLFHTSVVLWDAWAAYDDEGQPYLGNEKHTAGDVEDARAEAMSFAAYRLLKHRFPPGSQGSDISIPNIEATFDVLNDKYVFEHGKEFTSTIGDSPAALGNRIADRMINYGHSDGANEQNGYADYTDYEPLNCPLVVYLPGCKCDMDGNKQDAELPFPNNWQPLALEFFVSQNGIPVPQETQSIVAPWGGYVEPFGLTPDLYQGDGVYIDPGPPPKLGEEGDEIYKFNALELIEKSKVLDPDKNGGEQYMDIGPKTYHNNTAGSDDGEGYGINPVTGEPYDYVWAKEADYGRCIAEFWADGPASETPPGHWHVVANDMSDRKELELGEPLLIGGEGEPVDRLEWDVKMYLGLAGAVHDAGIAAWGVKRHYDYSRPITHIRYMATLGQSSDPGGPSYHPDGLPLVPGMVEVIEEEDIEPGGKFEHLRYGVCGDESICEIGCSDCCPIFECEEVDIVGEIAIVSWIGHPDDEETVAGTEWILGTNWIPYQLPTFVSPAFPGYVSGHSTFSRSASHYLEGFTGSPYFPEGIGTYTFEAGEFLEFEDGPSEDVTLTWATYHDAADEAGRSRRYGGIHPIADDYPARIMGVECGQHAWAMAQKYFEGNVTMPCMADLGRNGTVDSEDLNILLGSFLESANGDVDGDADTDAVDLNLLLTHYGESCDMGG